MKKIFKKNQIIVTVLAILIVIAGYLKYTDANFNNKTKKLQMKYMSLHMELMTY